MSQFLTAELNEKTIIYSSETMFFIQMAKGVKGCYNTQHVIKGNFAQAFLQYQGINLGNKYKKRLVMQHKLQEKEVLVQEKNYE